VSGPAAYWPPHLPRRLPRPATTLAYNLEVAASRYGERTAIAFFGRELSYRNFHAQANAFAGWLQKRAGVGRGDRVLLFLQNSPQWLVACYGALRADAVVVPANPMHRAEELRHVIEDSGARVAVCAQDLAETAIAAAGSTGLRSLVVAAYSDYLPERPEFALPEWLTAPRRAASGAVPWAAAIDAGEAPDAPRAGPEDFCLLPYTSGSTGRPKGCVHTHRSFMHTAAGLAMWHGQTPASVFLAVPPMYQVSGLANSVNCPIFAGGTIVPLPRWDPFLALQSIERYRATHVALAPAACIDLLASADLARHDLSSVRRITSGGSPMPEEVWKRLRDALGLPFIEAYGMTEAAATTHINPVERPKPQCLGVPFFDTEARIVDPATLAPLQPGEPGEILVRGPQLFEGYWRRPEETAAAFVAIDGARWYRSGDIGRVDEEGYFFMTDRLKRMINAAGHKVWPAEIETKLFEHPDVLEACVVGARDARRGETVKALVVLRPESRGRVGEADIVAWSRERMAAYKYPRIVEFVDALPKSPVGKVLWRTLQTRENEGRPSVGTARRRR
jgi:fatty-acyl-CoA synthase